MSGSCDTDEEEAATNENCTISKCVTRLQDLQNKLVEEQSDELFTEIHTTLVAMRKDLITKEHYLEKWIQSRALSYDSTEKVEKSAQCHELLCKILSVVLDKKSEAGKYTTIISEPLF